MARGERVYLCTPSKGVGMEAERAIALFGDPDPVGENPHICSRVLDAVPGFSGVAITYVRMNRSVDFDVIRFDHLGSRQRPDGGYGKVACGGSPMHIPFAASADDVEREVQRVARSIDAVLRTCGATETSSACVGLVSATVCQDLEERAFIVNVAVWYHVRRPSV